MPVKKHLLLLNGSASQNSSNERLIEYLARSLQEHFEVEVFNALKTLPHFDPELSAQNPPPAILDFRQKIARADGVIICTPEYVFSIPSGLKNAIEWCVADTVFSDKPTGLITASANGLKGHEELQLIMSTIMCRFTDATTLLIQGIKGKIDLEGRILDGPTSKALQAFLEAFSILVNAEKP